jgi:tetratricopeptide (TPR) repeat protein
MQITLLALALIFVLLPGRVRPGEPEHLPVVAAESAAQIAEREGRFDEAVEAHRRAIEAAIAMKRPALLAVLFVRMGATLEADNRVQDAVFAYESALRTLAEDKAFDLAEALQRMGTVRKGFLPGAHSGPADVYSPQTARDLAAAEEDPALAVKVLINIGNAYAAQPQDGPALNAYRQALARPEIEREPRLKGFALANSGELLRRSGDDDGAERMLLDALALLGRTAEPIETRRALTLLAGIRRDRGETDEARRLYAQALELYDQVADVRGEGRALAGLGRLQLDVGEAPAAYATFGRAVDRAQRANDDETLWYAYWGQGQSARRIGLLDDAALALRRSLDLITERQQSLRTDEGKVAFIESAQDVFDQLIDVHLERARTDRSQYAQALEVAEEARGRAISDLMQGWGRYVRPRDSQLGLPSCAEPPAESVRLRDSAHDVSDSIRQQAPGVPADLLQHDRTSVPQIPGGSRSVVPGISDEFQRGTSPNAAAFPNAAAMPNAAALPVQAGAHRPPRTRTKVSKPVARLVYHVMADHTAIFAVSVHGEVRGAVVGSGRAVLEREVGALRSALGVTAAGRGVMLVGNAVASPAAGARELDAALRRLYSLLVAPVEEALPGRDGLVALEPSGPLWLLPFAALLDSRGGPLVSRFALLYAPSRMLLDEVRSGEVYTIPSRSRALIVGNPVISPSRSTGDEQLGISFLPLPGADKEADRIARFFGRDSRKVLHGSQADLASVVVQAPDYSVLHFATHGIARADDPLESFVLLADSRCGDRLTARRVLSLSLRADLVTLSACQTGLGKIAGEGMIGLSRSFLIAGARSVVVSQWSIDDDATIGFMQSFYRDYLRQGGDKAQALRRAMLSLRGKPSTAHPRYWAAFTLVGAER